MMNTTETLAALKLIPKTESDVEIGYVSQSAVNNLKNAVLSQWQGYLEETHGKGIPTEALQYIYAEAWMTENNVGKSDIDELYHAVEMKYQDLIRFARMVVQACVSDGWTQPTK